MARPDNFRSFGQTRRQTATPGSGKRGGGLAGITCGFSQGMNSAWATVEARSTSKSVRRKVDLSLVKCKETENQTCLKLVALSCRRNGMRNVHPFVTHVRGIEAVYVSVTDTEGNIYTSALVFTETKKGLTSPGWPNRLQRAINKAQGK